MGGNLAVEKTTVVCGNRAIITLRTTNAKRVKPHRQAGHRAQNGPLLFYVVAVVVVGSRTRWSFRPQAEPISWCRFRQFLLLAIPTVGESSCFPNEKRDFLSGIQMTAYAYWCIQAMGCVHGRMQKTLCAKHNMSRLPGRNWSVQIIGC